MIDMSDKALRRDPDHAGLTRGQLDDVSENISVNPSVGPTLAEVASERLDNPSRRGLFKGAAMTAVLSFVGADAVAKPAAAREPAN